MPSNHDTVMECTCQAAVLHIHAEGVVVCNAYLGALHECLSMLLGTMQAAPTVFGWAGMGLAKGTPGLTLRAASVASKDFKSSRRMPLFVSYELQATARLKC